MEAAAPGTLTRWHLLSQEEALAGLGTSREGLSQAEAAARLAKHGPNALRQEDPVRPLALLLGQFRSLLVWILIVAAAVSGLLGEWLDCGAILAIVVLNAFIGFYQEYHAEKSLAALKRMTAPRARVRREGRSRMIPATEVVPGDILELEAALSSRLFDGIRRNAGMPCAEARVPCFYLGRQDLLRGVVDDAGAMIPSEGIRD